jgi:uncharacterized membrane protein YhaH (DUF805 family)
MEWMLMPYRRYADFSGRSRRKEFWMFQLLGLIVGVVIVLLCFGGLPLDAMGDPDALTAETQPGALFWVGAVLAVIWGLGSIIPSIAVTVRRLHDRDMSGWWYLGFIVASMIPLVNFIAAIAFLVLMVLPGTPGSNRFGPDPLGRADAEVFA